MPPPTRPSVAARGACFGPLLPARPSASAIPSTARCSNNTARAAANQRQQGPGAAPRCRGELAGGIEKVRRHMRNAALMLGALLTTSLPAGTAAQGARPVFQDNYADVNGMRLHYASIGKG